jgi:hypothetical protein
VSRYSPEQLREMARTALADRDVGGSKWLRLVMTLAMHFGVSPARVEAEIKRMAA